MKIIVAPDKFKESLTSMQVCECIKAGIHQANKDAAVHLFPMADGGDGFAPVMKYYLQTQTVQCNAVDPLMRAIEIAYEWDDVNKTAIIELASASGLELLKNNERNPLYTSTYGTGLIIKHAIDSGAEKIILGIGGSATNDAGVGILAASGFVFNDKNDNALKPTGENLQYLRTISPPPFLPAVEFKIACDVTNVLFGKEGAAFVYATQKGANDTAVKILDEGLRNFASVVHAQTGKDISSFPGSGAAGGVAAGLSAYFDVDLISGAQFVISISKLEEQIKAADLIITGEGRLDDQTNKGKVVQQVAALGKQYKIPVIAFCGEVNLSQHELQAIHLSSAYSLLNEFTGKDDAIKNAGILLPALVKNYFLNN